MCLTARDSAHIVGRMVVLSEHASEQTNGGPSRVGESLPKAMGPIEMARAFDISLPTFYRRQRAGDYKPFLLPRRLSPRGPRYSGEKVQAFLDGRK